MLPLIEAKRAEVAELCRRKQVRRLEIFGSAARDDFDPLRSDLDFQIEFETKSAMPGLDAYFGLKEELEALFGRPVDLAMPDAVRNRYVRVGSDRSRQLLYVA